MDSFELNKIAGAVLFALLVLFGTRTATDIIFAVHAPEKPGYEVAIPKGGEEGGAPKEAAGEKPLAVRLASADAKKGESVHKKCLACHTFDEGGKNKVGPNLHGVVGRPVASHEGFSYSDALKGLGGDWTYEKLDAFISNPKGDVPGTKMTFAGIKNDDQRADLILFLRTLSSNPPPLPKPEENAKPASGGGAAQKPEAAAENSLAALLASGDPKKGESVHKKCLACHTFDEGGKNKVGPNLHGVVGRPVASHEGFSYSDAMKSKGGKWTYAKLNEFLANPRGDIKGTKMTFAGIKDDKQRADLILFLRTLSSNPPPLPKPEESAKKPQDGKAAPAEKDGEKKQDEKPAAQDNKKPAQTGESTPAAPEAEKPVKPNTVPGNKAVPENKETPPAVPAKPEGEATPPAKSQ